MYEPWGVYRHFHCVFRPICVDQFEIVVAPHNLVLLSSDIYLLSDWYVA